MLSAGRDDSYHAKAAARPCRDWHLDPVVVSAIAAVSEGQAARAALTARLRLSGFGDLTAERL